MQNNEINFNKPPDSSHPLYDLLHARNIYIIICSCI